MSPTNYAHMLHLIPARIALAEAGLKAAKKMPRGPHRRAAIGLANRRIEDDLEMQRLCKRRLKETAKQVAA
jgi:hypothetical protein